MAFVVAALVTLRILLPRPHEDSLLEPEPEMQECENCGEVLEPDVITCPVCGGRVSHVETRPN